MNLTLRFLCLGWRGDRTAAATLATSDRFSWLDLSKSVLFASLSSCRHPSSDVGSARIARVSDGVEALSPLRVPGVLQAPRRGRVRVRPQLGANL